MLQIVAPVVAFLITCKLYGDSRTNISKHTGIPDDRGFPDPHVVVNDALI
jgi:hypothetical protein